jgi:hypothetical protein
MSAWETVFDLQTDLWNFYRSQKGEDFLHGFMDSMKDKGTYPYRIQDGEDREENAEADLPQLEIGRLYRADPIYVDPEMHELIKVAAETFEPEPLLPSDLITPNGFVLFPEAFTVTDIKWRTVTWRAALWQTLTVHYVDGPKQAILISLYSHTDDHGHDEDLKHLQDFPTKLALLHIAPWNFNVELPKDDRAKMPLRQLQTFFRISQQHITVPESVQPSRATRRRAKKAKMPEKNVTVIRLRRAKTKPEHEGEPVAWSHRWVVRGHWRNQWFPSLNAHRQIYIHDFIKGPEDKPLLITERRAFELVQ